MSSCSSPSALSCIPLSGGSYTWLGCYLDGPSATGFPASAGYQVTGFTGTATDCVTTCSTGNSGGAYPYASIEAGSCYCGTGVSSSPSASPSLCNIFCSDNSLCGGFDGTSVYSEAYLYTPGGTTGCPALSSTTSSSTMSSTTTTSSSTTMSTSTTSSATFPTGTSCDYLVNGNFASGVLAPWTSPYEDEIVITNTPPAQVIPFAPSTYVLQVSLPAGQNWTVQQTVFICPLTPYAPLIDYQLATDPSGGSKTNICTYQFCELVTKTCGRVATMRAGKWGSNSPQFKTKAGQTQAIVQVHFHCPIATVAFMGQLLMNPFGTG